MAGPGLGTHTHSHTCNLNQITIQSQRAHAQKSAQFCANLIAKLVNELVKNERVENLNNSKKFKGQGSNLEHKVFRAVAHSTTINRILISKMHIYG